MPTSKSKLKVQKERELVTTEFGKVHLTKYENDAYNVFAYEPVENEVHVSFLRKDHSYPEVFVYGVNVGSTGTLSAADLTDHIERLQIAKETYEQVTELFKEFRIRQY